MSLTDRNRDLPSVKVVMYFSPEYRSNEHFT